jgi:aldehyde dehydrogenase (NAD+)
VLCIIADENEDNAVRIADDTPYGLAAYIQSGNVEHARGVAPRMRAGNVQINYPSVDRDAPFGSTSNLEMGANGAGSESTSTSRLKASLGTERHKVKYRLQDHPTELVAHGA